MEMLKNKQINLNTVKDSRGGGPLSIALERHNRPLIKLFLKESLKTDHSKESQCGSLLFELISDFQYDSNEKRAIEDRMDIAKLLIKYDITDFFRQITFKKIQAHFLRYLNIKSCKIFLIILRLNV